MQELLLKIPYKTDEYEKITNKRLFNSESLFSQVGGLIGIILGVSFLQIPDILNGSLEILKTKYKQIVCKDNINSVTSLRGSSLTTQSGSRKHNDEYSF